MPVCEIRLERKRLAETSPGLSEFAEREIRLSEVVQRCWLWPPEPMSLLDQFNRGFVHSALQGNQSEQMQGVRISRLGLQYLPVELFRLGQSPGAVMLYRDLKRM